MKSISNRHETCRHTGLTFFMVALLFIALLSSSARSQDTNSGDNRVYELDTILVTAERTENPLSASTGAASMLTVADLQRYPISNISDALALIPGIVLFNRDGLGQDPIATVRGFYGGGEAEYLQVMVDGKPLNNIETGLVNWNSVPMSSIESIEVVRGGVSSLYGDAALGGIVNILTKNKMGNQTQFTSRIGTFNALSAQVRSGGKFKTYGYSLFASEERIDGFRDHADRRIENIGGTLSLLQKPRGSLSMSTAHNWVRSDAPGALSGPELDDSRTQSSPYYKFDGTDERKHRASLDGDFKLNNGANLSGSILGELRYADITRTLLLSPEFADTKNRELSTSRLGSSVQLTMDTLPTPFNSKLIVGVDASLNFLTSEYYLFFLGGRSDYQRKSAAVRGELDDSGNGERRAVAAFLQYQLLPIRALRIVLGGRFDALQDAYEPTTGQGNRTTTTHTEFSPKAGMNYRYMNTSERGGNLYANVSRAFKAPTLDQLFDQRSIPVQFPPFKISLSNSDLKPQFGTNLEIGAYHRERILQNTLTGEVSIAAYAMNLKNEFGFSLQEFRYVNIGESRHRGIEAGLKLYVKSNANVFLNYTHQSATSQLGEYKGNQLEGVPRNSIIGGVSAVHSYGIGGSLIVKSVNGIYLDDANTINLPGYATIDAKISYRYGRITAAVELMNLLDKSYSTTGFPDNTGSGLAYFYPAAGRYLRFNLNVQL